MPESSTLRLAFPPWLLEPSRSWPVLPSRFSADARRCMFPIMLTMSAHPPGHLLVYEGQEYCFSMLSGLIDGLMIWKE